MNNRKLYAITTVLLFALPLALTGLKLSKKTTSLQDILPKEVYTVFYEFDLSDLPQNAFVKAYIPLNTSRQIIRDQQTNGTKFTFSESENNLGKKAKWEIQNQEDLVFSHQFEVEGKSIEYTIPEQVQFETEFSTDLKSFLASTENIQSNNFQIDSLAQTLKGEDLNLTLKSNFDFVSKITNSDTGVLTDAFTALKRNRASCNGKSRLFVALCRAQGIPARVVGGIILENVRKRTSHLWTEVYCHGHWIPFDVLNQHFASLPANYLELYKGDNFLISHTKDIGFDYQFVIQKKHQTANSISNFGPQLWPLISSTTVPLNLIRGILLLPIAALVIAIFRNVVGLKTFGIFLPALVGLSLTKVSFATSFITFGIVILLVSLLHFILEKWGLLHIPKVVTMLTCVVLALIGLGVLGQNQAWEFLGTAMFFPVVILSITGERFAKTLVEEDFLEAMKILAATFFIALLCMPIFQSNLLLGFLLSYPEFYLIMLGTMLLLGRWIGMRVLEYRRFSAFSV